MIRFDKFTIKAQEAIADAQAAAAERSQQFIEGEHLLYALLRQEGGTVPSILNKMGVSPEAVAARVEEELEKFPRVTGAVQVQISPNLSQVFQQALSEADSMKDEYISTEHLLLALAEERKGKAGEILRSFGVTRDHLLRALAEVRGSQRVTDPEAESRYQALERFGRDLTELARKGKLDPVIGRDAEIRRVMQVLSR
ncbi:MAG: Clp protease N-terminal domain-containing protein, partial [Candidatus Geothermincolales bacterium]